MAMSDAERIAFLERELDRAWRALCGYATAAGNGVVLDKTAQAYHAPTVAAAKRYVVEGAMDGAEYFEGKPKQICEDESARTIDAAYGLVLGAFDGIINDHSRAWDAWQERRIQDAAMNAARQFLKEIAE